MSYLAIVPETAVVQDYTRLIIFTSCGLAHFTLWYMQVLDMRDSMCCKRFDHKRLDRKRFKHCKKFNPAILYIRMCNSVELIHLRVA